MNTITITWTITPSQRMELLNALLLAHRKRRSPKFKFPQETADLDILIDLCLATERAAREGSGYSSPQNEQILDDQ